MTKTVINCPGSVLADVTLGVQHCLQAAGHGVGEGGEELLLPADDIPGIGDLLGKVVQICSGLHSIPMLIC